MTKESTTKSSQSGRGVRQVVGVVVRKSGDQTASVVVTRVTRHPKYGKKIVSTKKYLVHDPDNVAVAGDQVTIRESRPRSARKRWVLVGNQPK